MMLESLSASDSTFTFKGIHNLSNGSSVLEKYLDAFSTVHRQRGATDPSQACIHYHTYVCTTAEYTATICAFLRQYV